MRLLARDGSRGSFIRVTIAVLGALAMSARFPPDWRAGGLSNPGSFMRLVRPRTCCEVALGGAPYRLPPHREPQSPWAPVPRTPRPRARRGNCFVMIVAP
jgi:hypothetical protein